MRRLLFRRNATRIGQRRQVRSDMGSAQYQMRPAANSRPAGCSRYPWRSRRMVRSWPPPASTRMCGLESSEQWCGSPKCSPVTKAASTPSRSLRTGRLMASASDDKTVRLWNARDSKAAPAVIQGHESAVLSVAFSPDGSRLATGSADRTTRVSSVQTPSSPPLVFRGHESPVLAVAFSADGLRLVSAGKDQSVRVWDARNPGTPQRVIGETQRRLRRGGGKRERSRILT